MNKTYLTSTLIASLFLSMNLVSAEVIVDTVFDGSISTVPATYGWNETLTTTGSSGFAVRTYTVPTNPYYAVNLTNGSGSVGYLSHSFTELVDPSLTLTLDVGFAFGDLIDPISFGIVDASGNGYRFTILRTNNPPSAVNASWSTITNYTTFGATTNAPGLIDTVDMTSINSGQALLTTTITRTSGGAWNFASEAFGSGGISNFDINDSTTSNFTQILLYSGGRSDKSFNNINLTTVPESSSIALVMGGLTVALMAAASYKRRMRSF